MVGTCGVGGTREVGVWVSRDFLSSFFFFFFFLFLDVTLLEKEVMVMFTEHSCLMAKWLH